MSVAIPAPGIYVLEEEQISSYGPAGGGSATVRHHVRVLGPASCGGPHIDVVYYPHGRKPIQRTIRIAIDGSWRDVTTLLPINVYGEVIK